MGIPAFPAVSLEAGPSAPPRRPGALVTFRQDLLITVRAVITTVRLRLGLAGGTVVRVRLSRWYIAFRKHLVTCDVRAWQLNSKVSAPYGIKTGQNTNLEKSQILALRQVYGEAPGATQRTSMEVD